MTDFNCKKRCGVCCIVCTEISLTKEEYESRKFKMSKTRKGSMHDNIKSGWSSRKLKFKSKYIPELNLMDRVCFYFDTYRKECAIYDSRPEVCRVWNCKDERFVEKGLRAKAHWEKLLEWGKQRGEWAINDSKRT